jgi:hypothetical protein
MPYDGLAVCRDWLNFCFTTEAGAGMIGARLAYEPAKQVCDELAATETRPCSKFDVARILLIANRMRE